MKSDHGNYYFVGQMIEYVPGKWGIYMGKDIGNNIHTHIVITGVRRVERFVCLAKSKPLWLISGNSYKKSIMMYLSKDTGTGADFNPKRITPGDWELIGQELTVSKRCYGLIVSSYSNIKL